MKVYDNLRLAMSSDTIYCSNCSQPNPIENETCENCGIALIRPASFFQNLLDVLARPLRGMRRIAATAPLVQALLVVILATAAQLMTQNISLLRGWQYYYDNPAQIDEELAKALRENRLPTSATGPFEMLIVFLIFLIGWVLFTGGIHYAARIFYKQEARIKFNVLFSIIGMSRITYLLPLLLLVLSFIVPDIAIAANILVQLRIITIWQLVLVIIGVKAASGFNWNRSTLIVMIPALIFMFLIPLPL